MTRKDFIDYLVTNNIPYTVDEVYGTDSVYVFSRKEYEEKKRHPRKNKNLYVPYLRISHFDTGDGRWYTRDNGLTGYMKIRKIMEIVEELGA